MQAIWQRFFFFVFSSVQPVTFAAMGWPGLDIPTEGYIVLGMFDRGKGINKLR